MGNDQTDFDIQQMQRAIELAYRGQGMVEPNPMVGCVIVRDGEVIGEGYHQVFGGTHAEINALRAISNGDARGATAYVTLEPCAHTGKTGPCADALIEAKIARVVVGCVDPFSATDTSGMERMKAAGIKCELGPSPGECLSVVAPFIKRVTEKQPWIVAKWAMTVDGKIATRSGESQWISNPQSRAIGHQIRGRVDAIMVGSGTALADDPMLNARPEGLRTATRIVVDSEARLPLDSKLVKTANEYPVLCAVGPSAGSHACKALSAAGVEVIQNQSEDSNQRLKDLLTLLAERGMTNVMVEGGGRLLGSLSDLRMIDECHVFIGPKVFGGAAPGPILGAGVEQVDQASQLKLVHLERLEDDIYAIYRRNSRP